jgi:methylated-DNA-[protein]-cysteine S-methyltransferase
MRATGFTLFGTALGPSGIAWGRAASRCALPERHATATRERLRRRYPCVPEAPLPPEVQRAIDGVIAFLRGEPRELSNVALYMEGIPLFRQPLYTVLRTVPTGSAITYGDLAVRAMAARQTMSARQWAKTRSPSLVRATGLWRPTARWAGSLPRVTSQRSCGC